MKAVRVKKELAEEIRKRLERNGFKDRRRRIRFESGYVIIPVVDEFNLKSPHYEIVEDTNPIFRERKNFREIVTQIAGFYPRYADLKVFGDVGLMKLPDSVMHHKKRIAERVAENYRLSSVWLDMGKHGMKRMPRMEPLVGSKSLVEVKENGCIFRFDITEVMFSQGNQYEKMRTAKLVEDGERVVDMFAGIGYFTIPVMKHSNARKCLAIELNHKSYRFLLENLKLNGIKKVIPILGDSMHVTPESCAERVIMGHIRCENFIKTAIDAIDGEGWIHYHEAVPVKVIHRPVERIRREAESLNARVAEVSLRKVKNYSPNVYHVVVDARIRKC